MRRVLLGLLVLVLAYFAVSTALVARWMGKDERPRVDAIVGLGAAQYDGRPSAIYRARLEHAVDLYRGGGAPPPGGGGGAGGAREGAPPASAVLAEEKSRTPYQNLAGAKRTLQRHAPAGRRPRIVIVSDPFHMFPAVQQAADLGLDAYPSPTRTSPLSASRVKLTESVLREDLAIAGYLLSGRGK